MFKFLKALALFVVFSIVLPIQVVPVANAQVMGTQMYCPATGLWMPPGVQCGTNGVPQQQYQQPCVQATVNGRTACYDPRWLQQQIQQQQYQQQGYAQNVAIPQGIAAGQLFNAMVNGQPSRCSWSDRGASGVVGAGIGNALAYAINRLAHKDHDVIDRRGATAVGGLVGATVMCSPDIVNDNVAVQRQVIAQQSQQAVYRPQQPQPTSYYSSQGGQIINLPPQDVRSISEPSTCNIEGLDTIVGISLENCQKIRNRMTTSAPASLPNQRIAATQVTSVVATASATATTSSTVSNFCVRAGKKYDCGDKVVVIRPGGEIQCIAPQQAKESGDQMCTGIQ